MQPSTRHCKNTQGEANETKGKRMQLPVPKELQGASPKVRDNVMVAMLAVAQALSKSRKRGNKRPRSKQVRPEQVVETLNPTPPAPEQI